jgi:tetratricopeptide (TPR) repeat protein
LRDYETGNHRAALHHFVAAVHQEPGAGLLAATIYARHEQGIKQAVMLLEAIVQAEIEFPTPLMKKYLVDHVQVQLDVTPNITVTVPADGLLATLLLVELYQDQGRMEEAIGLLEEIEELSGEPVVTLSLCELYAYEGIWDGIIERGQGIPVEDDITLEISVFYGRAMQEKGLHDAALQVFGAALKKKKGYNPMLLREATYWRAVSYQKLGKKRQAHKAFQKLYAETPDFRDVAERVTLPL